MMIQVGHEKGGVGKSTLAIHLAAWLAKSFPKKKVILVDADVSMNTQLWAQRRAHYGLETSFTVVGQAVSPTSTMINLSEMADFVVVDVGAGNYTRLMEMSRIVDLWIAPTTVGQKEMDSNMNVIEAFQAARHLHKRGSMPLVWAINLAPTNLVEVPLVADFLQATCPDIPVLPQAICNRKVFRDADKQGKTIFEMPAKAREKAEHELSTMFSQAMLHAKQFANAAA